VVPKVVEALIYCFVIAIVGGLIGLSFTKYAISLGRLKEASANVTNSAKRTLDHGDEL
jgi:hypothetical protein